ncbi:hypothetical protein ACFYZ8_19195 [Streptomyces sp. NPDC001668]|uniref:hypothetical protein n=1 Tax=unclassified Streptomyces TaxID=2593676 RepID=UPI0036BE0EBF
MLHEDRGVGPLRVGVDVHDLLGGDAAAPVAYGVGDRADQLVEGGGGRDGVVEVSDGCVHDGTLTAAQDTAGTETAMTISIGTAP